MIPAVDYLQAMRARRPMKRAVEAVRELRRRRGADARHGRVSGDTRSATRTPA
jgi:hypothetical protein